MKKVVYIICENSENIAHDAYYKLCDLNYFPLFPISNDAHIKKHSFSILQDQVLKKLGVKCTSPIDINFSHKNIFQLRSVVVNEFQRQSHKSDKFIIYAKHNCLFIQFFRKIFNELEVECRNLLFFNDNFLHPNKCIEKFVKSVFMFVNSGSDSFCYKDDNIELDLIKDYDVENLNDFLSEYKKPKIQEKVKFSTPVKVNFPYEFEILFNLINKSASGSIIDYKQNRDEINFLREIVSNKSAIFSYDTGVNNTIIKYDIEDIKSIKEEVIISIKRANRRCVDFKIKYDKSVQKTIDLEKQIKNLRMKLSNHKDSNEYMIGQFIRGPFLGTNKAEKMFQASIFLFRLAYYYLRYGKQFYKNPKINKVNLR